MCVCPPRAHWMVVLDQVASGDAKWRDPQLSTDLLAPLNQLRQSATLQAWQFVRAKSPSCEAANVLPVYGTLPHCPEPTLSLESYALQRSRAAAALAADPGGVHNRCPWDALPGRAAQRTQCFPGPQQPPRGDRDCSQPGHLTKSCSDLPTSGLPSLAY